MLPDHSPRALTSGAGCFGAEAAESRAVSALAGNSFHRDWTRPQADQALVGQRARPHRNIDRLSPTTPAHSITSSTNHSSKAIEIEDVEFLVVERVAEAQKEETLRPVNLRPPEFQIGYLEKLAPDYIGERHIATVSRDQDGNIGGKSGPVRRRLNEDDGKLPLFGVLVPARDGQPALGDYRDMRR
jgi:hypothetical protein